MFKRTLQKFYYEIIVISLRLLKNIIKINKYKNFLKKIIKNYKNYLETLNKLTPLYRYGEEKIIYVIGDSHTDIFSKNQYDKKIVLYDDKNSYPSYICYENLPICSIHLGPATAYGLNIPNTKTRSLFKINYISKFLNFKNTTVIFSFGKIDCRLHIKRQSILQNMPIPKILNNTVNNYFKFLKNFINNHNNTKIICYGPIASQKDYVPEHPSFPRCGSEVERNIITQDFNKSLEKICKDLNIGYTTVFYDMINDNFETDATMLCDTVHLSTDALPILNKAFKEFNISL